MQVKIKRLHPEAIIPGYATQGSACFDLHALTGKFHTLIEPQKAATYGTGLAIEVPEGHVMLAFSRSGHGFKNDTRLANCVGVIDSDYRGELFVKLHNDNHPASGVYFRVEKGDRIAQALILPVEQVVFEEVNELSSTDRGANGFGSTGVKPL